MSEKTDKEELPEKEKTTKGKNEESKTDLDAWKPRTSLGKR